MINDNVKYLVKDIKKENENTKTISLSFEDGSMPIFINGQFITVYFDDLNVNEGKAYSISSPFYRGDFSITVKEMGLFSSKLCNLKVGDKLSASLPYGFFYTEEKDTDLVFISSGIGITPFNGIILQKLNENEDRKIELHYSISYKKDGVFLDNFFDLEKDYENMSFNLYVTKEKVDNLNCFNHRINIKEIIKNKDKNTEYFICGSIDFVKDMWRNLKDNGISDEFIYTEAFFHKQ